MSAARHFETLSSQLGGRLEVPGDAPRFAQHDREAPEELGKPELRELLDGLLERGDRLLRFSLFDVHIAEPSQPDGRVEGIGRVLECAPASGDPSIVVSERGVDNARRPGRRAPELRISHGLADRRGLALSHEGWLELPAQGMTEPDRPVRRADPPSLPGSLQERGSLTTMLDAFRGAP